MKTQVLLSICIPTYNRLPFLKECLEHIIKQIKDNSLGKVVEVIVSNNASTDTTESYMHQLQKKYSFIHYFKNKENIGADSNVMKAASYAKGSYIWFFSDDDIQKKNAIKTALHTIENHQPDAILCNMDLYSKDMRSKVDPSLLRADTDQLFTGKKQLFSYLENKFFLPIDWYITCLSNTIVKKNIFQKHRKHVDIPSNIFRHSSLIYYTPEDYQIAIIADPIIKFRADNRSFGPAEKVAFLIYWYNKLNEHNAALCHYNKKYISYKFRFLVLVKNAIRSARLYFLKIVGYDISDVLMKLFYK